jgi:hypothetical protein
MSGRFNFSVSKGSKSILEEPRQVFVLIWPVHYHWGIFLPDRYSSSSSGKMWHVRVMDLKIKRRERHSKNASKLLKLLLPCTGRGVDILKENRILNREKCKVLQIEGAFATESLIDSITKKIEQTFHYEAFHENYQAFVVEVMRELESQGFATREAVGYARR